MKKLVLPLWLLFASSFYLKAQSRPVNPLKDNISYQGYTVRLIPAAAGSYGYDILKDKELILHQGCNPFTLAPVGLREKSDAYKVAKWQIAQMQRQSRNTISNRSASKISLASQGQTSTQVSINKPLGKELADQLNIAIH